MSNSHPRILIIYPYSSIDTNPTLSSLLEMLAGRGVSVDVLLCEDEDFLSPESFGDAIHLEYWPAAFLQVQGSALKRLVKHIARSPLHPQLCSCLMGADPLVFGLLKAGRYSVIVGVDPYGIAVADRLNRLAKRPLVYISFEMILAAEVASASEEALRRREQAACERTSLLLIQDHERAAVFSREKDFPEDKILLVPVAPPPQQVAKSDYLRKTLGIPVDKRIVLYSGALELWASRDELEEMVSYWSDRFCLVIHNRSRIHGRLERYLKRLAETGKVYVSTQPVARKDLLSLVASADFGLAPYKPVPDEWWTGDNIYHIGLSSGKVSYYAMCGLPILARSLPVFDYVFANYPCGKVYRRIAETGQMLEEMDRDYAHYSSEARRFYQERLNPVEGMRQFCDSLMKLAGIG